MDHYIYPRNFSLWGNVGFNAAHMDENVKRILSLPTAPVSATVGFVGIPAAISAMKDENIKRVYNDLTYVSIDGMPVVKKARKAGLSCERCTGPDTMMLLLEESVRQGKTHYFYGGKNDKVLENIRRNLTERFPDIKIVGMYSPPFRDLTPQEDDDLCREINSLRPDFVWVGIGQPRQDIWLDTHRRKINNAILLGVGAAFDFAAGSLDRAPETVRRLGIEWLYRFLKEPRRLFDRYVKGGFRYLYYSARFKSRRIRG